MSESFSVIGNLAVTRCIVTSGIFESKQVTKAASESKYTIKLTKCYVFLNRAFQTFS